MALIPEGVSVLAWPQNDEAAKRWLDDLSTKVPVQAARAIVPEQFKDLNEWTKAGASAEDIYSAIFRNELVEKPEIAQPVSEQETQPSVALVDLLDSICAFLQRHISFHLRRSPSLLACGSCTLGSLMRLSSRLISTFFHQRDNAVNRIYWTALPSLYATS